VKLGGSACCRVSRNSAQLHVPKPQHRAPRTLCSQSGLQPVCAAGSGAMWQATQHTLSIAMHLAGKDGQLQNVLELFRLSVSLSAAQLAAPLGGRPAQQGRPAHQHHDQPAWNVAAHAYEHSHLGWKPAHLKTASALSAQSGCCRKANPVALCIITGSARTHLCKLECDCVVPQPLLLHLLGAVAYDLGQQPAAAAVAREHGCSRKCVLTRLH
jgi:hypothetical protein